MQAQLRNFFDDFGERISFIRQKRGLTLAQLAEGASSTAKSWEGGTRPRPDQWEPIARRLGLSVSFVFLGKPVTREDFDFVAKFADEITPHGSPKVEESPSGEVEYDKLRSSSPQKFPRRDVGKSPMQITPGFEPAAPPLKREQILSYVVAYLDEAEKTPGGLGLAWGLVRKHLDPEDLRRMREE